MIKKTTIFAIFAIMLCFGIQLGAPDIAQANSSDYEIKIYTGEASETIKFFKTKNFWGEQAHDEDLAVPPIIVAVVDKRWVKDARNLPVDIKKELFYRTIIPMILFSNKLIMQERQELVAISSTLDHRKPLSEKEQTSLQSLGNKYGLPDSTDPGKQLGKLLERVDIIPPSLALGQAAYESGYGTSRFTLEGNALFGQWTYGGGMKPREHRTSKGNYGVAAYNWPFDSVRAYMLNLNSHKAYKALRDKRALLRRQGKKITGMTLAETLDKYSERGMEYVETLHSIIRVNGLAIADKAYLRNEPVTLVVEVGHTGNIQQTEAEIAELRKSGELNRIIKSMQLHK